MFARIGPPRAASIAHSRFGTVSHPPTSGSTPFSSSAAPSRIRAATSFISVRQTRRNWSATNGLNGSRGEHSGTGNAENRMRVRTAAGTRPGHSSSIETRRRATHRLVALAVRLPGWSRSRRDSIATRWSMLKSASRSDEALLPAFSSTARARWRSARTLWPRVAGDWIDPPGPHIGTKPRHKSRSSSRHAKTSTALPPEPARDSETTKRPPPRSGNEALTMTGPTSVTVAPNITDRPLGRTSGAGSWPLPPPHRNRPRNRDRCTWS